VYKDLQSSVIQIPLTLTIAFTKTKNGSRKKQETRGYLPEAGPRRCYILIPPSSMYCTKSNPRPHTGPASRAVSAHVRPSNGEEAADALSSQTG
jgi:hypothetical protein